MDESWHAWTGHIPHAKASWRTYNGGLRISQIDTPIDQCCIQFTNFGIQIVYTVKLKPWNRWRFAILRRQIENGARGWIHLPLMASPFLVHYHRYLCGMSPDTCGNELPMAKKRLSHTHARRQRERNNVTQYHTLFPSFSPPSPSNFYVDVIHRNQNTKKKLCKFQRETWKLFWPWSKLNAVKRGEDFGRLVQIIVRLNAEVERREMSRHHWKSKQIICKVWT